MASGSGCGGVPGFQKRKWLSGSKRSDTISRSIPESPTAGSAASRWRAHPAAIEQHVGVMHESRRCPAGSRSRARIASSGLARAGRSCGTRSPPSARARSRAAPSARDRASRAARRRGTMARPAPRRGRPSALPAFTHAASVAIASSAQPPLADEVAMAFDGRPRRHVTPAGDLHNLPRAPCEPARRWSAGTGQRRPRDGTARNACRRSARRRPVNVGGVS